MSYNYLPLDRKWLHFEQVKHLLDFQQLVSITFDAHERIVACRTYLDQKMQDESACYYGINTGFGFLQNVRIDASSIEQLQYNLLVSHACGLGEEVPADIVRLMLMLKIKSLSYGHSGVQIETVKRLMSMYNEDVLPVIYTQGRNLHLEQKPGSKVTVYYGRLDFKKKKKKIFINDHIRVMPNQDVQYILPFH